MAQTVFEKMKTAISVLKLDFTTEEFATFADDQELSEEAIEAIQAVFSYICWLVTPDANSGSPDYRSYLSEGR